MSQEAHVKEKALCAERIFVMSKEESGYRIYAVDQPDLSYLVIGTVESPHCTCADFREHGNQTGYRCEHIKAVFREKPGNGNNPNPSSKELEGESIVNVYMPIWTNLLIKRSVSPDGKIDALSVEFTHTDDLQKPDEIKSAAEKMLSLQADIITRFLSTTPVNAYSRGNGHNTPSAPVQPDVPVVPVVPENAVMVQMTHIAGRQTKYGWKLYINVRVNGQIAMLFGNKKKLGEYITAAGFPDLARNINEGDQLNIQCRAILANNGKSEYPNIERILPLNGSSGERRH